MPDTPTMEGIGLGGSPISDSPAPPSATVAGPAIDLLPPGSERHDFVKDYLLQRLRDSERKMNQFHARWQVSEKKMQAYIDLPNWEKTLKEMNDSGKPPLIVSVTIPLSFAMISTIVTFLLHTFSGRKPMFQVGSYKAETVKSSKNMETVIQYNADHTRLIKWLYQFFQDGQIYGLGVLRSRWKVETALRTVRKANTLRSIFGITVGSAAETVRELHTIYEGNEVTSQDPYMFFPDPRVPMTEVNRRGEYVFTRSYEGRHILLQMQEDENLNIKWIDHIPNSIPRNFGDTDDTQSVRSLMSGGDAHPGSSFRTGDLQQQSFVQLDQGSVFIIPRELGLGHSMKPEKWLFTIANKERIIQAEPADDDHGMHSVAVAEPYTMGYSFGSLGLADYLGPLQDSISWLMNSHIDNVRKALNDMFIVNPAMIEMQDLKNPAPGKLIRLKQAAFGTDVREAVMQLQVNDVTKGHLQDLELFLRISQLLSAVSDNVLGLQEAGGRKTATEVRTSTEAAASRLAAQARIISAQAIVDLTEQMSVNIQQRQSDDFYISVVGREGAESPIKIRPDQLAGDFFYPIHDGTLPLDRVAMVDVWRELFSVVLQDQQLRGSYDIPRMFEFIAELGGAKNIAGMRLDVAPDAAMQQGVQAGNVVPIPGGNPVAPPQVDLGLGTPANRAAGGLQ